MCGIAGVVFFGEPKRDFEPRRVARKVEQMCIAQAHRGPDMNGVWQSEDGRCTLGHRRLSILDLSDGGLQPMADAAGRFHLTFNGEIYNYRSLRSDLESEGVKFKTQTDTEVLLEGFARYGLDYVSKLDGMFAAAIYDSKTKDITLFRDRAGEKPLYVHYTDGQMIFSSEMHALAGVIDGNLDISPMGLGLYLTLRYVPPPHTIISGIEKISPGQIVVFSPHGSMTVRRYFAWELEPAEIYGADHFAEKAVDLEAKLVTSISDRLQSDVPLGLFLSSGIDSSLVCALTKIKLGRTPKTFSIGFQGDSNSEHFIAEKIANILQTEHHTFMLSPAELAELGASIGAVMDEPNGDRSCVPTLLLSREVSQQVTVALSGDGADELFGGYGRYGLALENSSPHTHPLDALREYFNKALPVFGLEAVEAICGSLNDIPAELLSAFRGVFVHPRREWLHIWRELDLYSYLPGAVLAKVDRMSMRHGLEVRTPFLSPEVMEIAAKMPSAYLLHKGVRKFVLRKLLQNYLPDAIVSLPKRGFGMPESVFVNNAEMIGDMLNSALRDLGQTRFFGGHPHLLKNLSLHASTNINSAWSVIVLGQWTRAFPKAL